MILQSLTKLYEDLAARGEISRSGWNPVRIGFALCLNGKGEPVQMIPLTEQAVRNGKTVLVAQTFELPAPVKRASGILPNFLWDNSSFIFGFRENGNDKRNLECFEACKKHHKALLAGTEHPVAKAILGFFETWDPEQWENCQLLAECKDELMKGANIVFRVDGVYPHTVPEIADAWQRYYDRGEGETAQCLVSGETDIIEPTHPSVKGVAGAQSSGAALVSFNAPAFCSYNREQCFNAPIGKRSAFAYTTALNHLLADRENVQRIGDTTVVCWADGAEPAEQDVFLASLFGKNVSQTMSEMSEDVLRATVERLAEGKPCDEMKIDPSRDFYILGIAPNAARLSVRFFLRTTFGDLMRNVNEHHKRAEIAGSRYKMIPLWALLSETANPNSKELNQVMAGSVARAVFQGTRYPASLLEATVLRIRSERKITPGRAAILKAYYLKNTDIRCPKEVLTVSLNETSTNIPYTVGRLFAVYEAVQEAANPGINATIKDKYFNSVASTPAYILPILDKLCHTHLRKLDVGKRIYFDKQLSALKNILGEENPARLSLPEQGSFYLGYYHQKQKRFEKKEND